MRTLLIITFLANIAFAFGSLPWQPEKIAVHFSLDGTAGRFESPIVSAISMSIIVGIAAAVFIGLSALVSRSAHMPELFNMPNREYWLNDENRPKTIRRICSSIDMIGIGTMLFILFLQWEMFQANQRVPPILRSYMLYAFGVFVTYIVFDQVRLYRLFCRLPEDGEPQEPQV